MSKPMVTLNVINMMNSPRRQTSTYENAAYTNYMPGSATMLSIQGTF
jgi:hypothetical protein